MPKKKKSSSKGKARKAKVSKQGGYVGNIQPPLSLGDHDDVGEVAENFDSILSIEDMMSQMHLQIVSSLGDGYDAQSLQNMDKKLCNYFLDDDSFYYDDGKHTKSVNTSKPTDDEVEHYKQSIIIRKGVLRKAIGIEATSNFLGGQGILNLQPYADFYEDIMTYYYAWFELIFKEDRSELFLACTAIVRFVSVKLESGGDVNEIHKINDLLKEIKEMFVSSVKEHDVEGCDNAGELEFDCYEIWYKMSIEMAKLDREDEAEDYFDQALMAENTWGYIEEENRHCGKVLEFALGRRLSREEVFDMGMYSMENEGFHFQCLKAFLNHRKGSVSWTNEEEDEYCNNCGMPSELLAIETGKKLLRCVRCKQALYCGKECQVAHWKRAHKKECNIR